VLVVDDDPEARALYRQILARHGVPVTEAVDGEEALARIAAEPPALVILDLMMPKVDGFEVLARLRADARTQALPVVVVTAKELTDADHTRLASADRVLAKAGDLTRLLSQDLASVLGALTPAGKDAP
jgi:CheY-like chemotaxis protein